MKQVLNNIFAEPQPINITATVRTRLSPGCYEVMDDTGRIFQAYSTVPWSPADRVLVQSDRILSAGGIEKNIKIYEV